MGVPLNIPDFKEVQWDGIPAGNRIFRMAYFDPEGRMTIMQWNTAKQGVDYRIGPRGVKVGNFIFRLPFDISPGEMKVIAQLNYQLLVKPVADFSDKFVLNVQYVRRVDSKVFIGSDGTTLDDIRTDGDFA